MLVTYHDPCRLARQAGIMDAPRTLIESIPGIMLKEMEHNRENALCCGTSAWMGCSSCSKGDSEESYKRGDCNWGADLSNRVSQVQGASELRVAGHGSGSEDPGHK